MYGEASSPCLSFPPSVRGTSPPPSAGGLPFFPFPSPVPFRQLVRMTPRPFFSFFSFIPQFFSPSSRCPFFFPFSLGSVFVRPRCSFSFSYPILDRGRSRRGRFSSLVNISFFTPCRYVHGFLPSRSSLPLRFFFSLPVRNQSYRHEHARSYFFPLLL